MYHIGDTPMDLLAAQAAGAKAIGVLTGTHTREELEAAGVGELPLVRLLVLGLSPRSVSPPW
jgi:ribonucleotide monophosphatase NagD (HAD superfamily)